MPVVSERREVQSHLGEMGLEEIHLESAVRRGELERASATILDPKTAGGFDAWRWAFRSLAESLVPRGWRKVDTHNQPRLIHPRLPIAVTVTSGSPMTGLTYEDAVPTTKYRKGQVTQRLVQRNRQVLLPFCDTEEGEEATAAAAPEECATWLLLVYPVIRTAPGPGELPQVSRVRYELSLPSAVDMAGDIVEWESRIVLPEIDLEASVDTQPEDEAGDFDVPVSRRS